MASNLCYLNNSPKLFKIVFPNLYKQLQHSSPVFRCSASCKTSSSRYSTKRDIKIEELNGATTNSDLITKNLQNIVSDSDNFGNLKISLESVHKVEKNAIPQSNALSEKSKKYNTLPSKTSIRKKDSSDKFGSLANDSIWYTETAEPESGGKNIIFEPEPTKFQSPHAYYMEMRALIKQKKIKEALELFPEMRRNKACIVPGHYTLMIGACGKVGYTEMAFKLLKEMLDRNMRPSPATLTGLFNSCAECPFPEYGLNSAKKLKRKVEERNWLLTLPSYHAMIKAFGRCGDLLGAFQIVDEMIKAGTYPCIATYNFLLMSCISDKEAGFTHALEIWRKLKQKRMIPTIHTFNLLLRAARDCGIGPQETSDLLLQHWSSYIKRPYGFNIINKKNVVDDMLKLPNPQLSMIEGNSVKQLTTGSTNTNDVYDKNLEKENSENLNSTEVMQLPPNEILHDEKPKILTNLLAKRPIKGPIFLDLINIQRKSDRLALLGNAEGFLQTMTSYKVKPDVKTFMLFLENSPDSAEIEEELIALMDEHKVQPDTDFFNILIKRRNMRKDFLAAKNVLLLIYKYNLSPDIVTFGVLAIGCKKKKSGQQLLREMKKVGYHANSEIMSTLVNNACFNNDFDYMMEILEAMSHQKIKPYEDLLKNIENKLEVIRALVINKEQGKEVPPWMTDNICKQYYEFCNFYTKWLQKTEVDLGAHPWDQYKVELKPKDLDNIPMPLMY